MRTFYSEQLEKLKNTKSSSILDGMLRGIEKENVRVTNNGHYARSAHPQVLGSPLLNSNLTLDFSEVLLEEITSPCESRNKLFRELLDINTWVVQKLAKINPEQYLWPYSMPLLITEQDVNQIKIANFGSSAIGQMKTIYRQGLVHRYGKAMQLISGIHYNLSWPEEFFKLLGPLTDIPLANNEPHVQALKSQRYLGLIRNFYRYQWLIPLLFGASPVCFGGSLMHGTKPAYLLREKDNVFNGLGTTSLRLSSIGYQNKAQASIDLSYKTIKDYAKDLLVTTQIPDPNFSCIAARDQYGNYQQLNNHVLQIENEFYSAIRPKASQKYQERPAVALAKYGIEYIELRALDLDLFAPDGISPETSAFCDLWLTHLLLMPSPDLSAQETTAATYNLNLVVGHGRYQQDGCYLAHGGISIQELALHLLQAMQPLAQWMDSQGEGYGVEYTQALATQIAKTKDPSLLPSAQIVKQWQDSNNDFIDFILGIQKTHQHTILNRQLSASVQNKYDKQAQDSLVQEQMLLEKEHGSLEDYIKQYFKQTI